MQSYQKIKKTSAIGHRGAVACARIESSRAAMEMIEAGGNAMDAAVAAAFVAGVVEPMETTLAGSGFLLVHRPGVKQVQAIDFGPRAPLAARPDMFKIDASRSVDRGLGVSVVEDDANIRGVLAIGVPAVIRGLTDGHWACGRLPLSRVLAPAIRAAHDGFEIDNYYTLEALSNLQGLRADEGARNLFLRNGMPPMSPHLGSATLGAAERLRQKALGRSLEVIAEKGADAFYVGEIARDLLRTVAELGGILNAEDLAGCRSAIGAARTIRFRDADVWVPNAPCGALTQLQMLKWWAAFWGDRTCNEDTAERLRIFSAVSRHAFADRYYWLGDPDFVPVPERALLSDGYAMQIASDIAAHGVPIWQGQPQAPWDYFSRHRAHDPGSFEQDARALQDWNPGGATEPGSGTTHVSVMDEDGMAVAITHTAANHFGSNVVCQRTGFLLDAAMGWFNALPGAANSIAPGKRPLANMAPMMLTRRGESIAALGAPGGRRIISCIAQIAINLIERGHDAEQAVNAPRCDASGNALLISERLQHLGPESAKSGEAVLLISEQHEGYGYELARPNIVVRDFDGLLEAASEPFAKGFALAI